MSHMIRRRLLRYFLDYHYAEIISSPFIDDAFYLMPHLLMFSDAVVDVDAMPLRHLLLPFFIDYID